MRLTSALLTSALALSLGVPATVVATATPASAAEACSLPLDPDRRTAYRLKNGTDVLPYGQVVVQATRDQYHRYCVRFSTGGREVVHSFSMSSEVREGGACTTQIGALGSGAYRTGGYTHDMRVPDGECEYRSYAIRADGRWYTARIMRYNA